MRKTRASATEWATRVQGWRASGETAQAYAQRQGWNVSTLRCWASRLGRAPAGEDAPVPRSFVRVVARREAEQEVSPGVLEVVLAGARVIRVAPGADLEFLCAVVESLEVR